MSYWLDGCGVNWDSARDTDPYYISPEEEAMLEERHAREDGAAAAQLSEEREQRAMLALYDAAMRGVEVEHLRTLCYECGVTYEALKRYVPPPLRQSNREEDDPIQMLPF